ncbi:MULTISPECIES: hypothetical protein [Anaerococcus]|jgi:hypothetical protein|uniref:hypothetical protein n=1 Tax=Anaerococcus TaxID=165779 RepID=UPI001AE5A23C|nr:MULTISPECIES: hypothetical protein [Anaerococcus]MBP2069509.1 PhnB protein [Anaerococcus nagyae]MDU1864180.1 hypothetical protein [Anaerococcus sp.]MDU2565360.1 hypothetical protein [Anaerococcus sp.]
MAVGITFKNGECLDAVDYYCEVFDLEKPKTIFKYSDFKEFKHPEKIKNRIYLTYLEIYGNKIYMQDTTIDENLSNGNNVKIVIETSADDLYKSYMNFRKDSRVIMEPQKVNSKLLTTFLVDKYDIGWQFIADLPK